MDDGSVLEVKNLTKIFFNTQDGIAGGVRDASFSLTPGTFFTLLGPSGCGKTTTLRCIAGLEQPDSGAVRLGERVIYDGAAGVSVPLNRRNMGMVFQSYAIWPHMSVFENVAFPLRVANDRSYSKDEIVRHVGEALTRVGLNGFQTRSATRLSGGQQQRVALARAIVRQPKLLLLDEPLSNLDATLRDEMRNELKRLQREVGVTTIYVTHDQTEALEMSDLVAVIDKGRIVQMAPPRDIYFHPKNAFVAGFVGATNLLPATIARPADGEGIAAVTLDGVGDIGCAFESPMQAGDRISVSIRPETIMLKALKGPRTGSGPDVNRLPGTIALSGFLGNMNRYTVKVGPHSLQVNTEANVVFETGADVALEFSRKAALGVPG